MSHHLLCGRRYELVYVHLPSNLDGDCDPPDRPHKKIRIAKRLEKDQLELLKTLLHESLHGCLWDVSEEWTEQAANDIAALLYREGWRRLKT